MVFNDGLRARQHARAEGLPYLSDGELSKRVTAAKLTPERVWLGDVSSVVLQQALADLNVAYRDFFASFVIQAPDDPLPPTDSEVGIDLGLTHFAVLSDGTKVAAPRFLRQAARKLKRLQQALSRKTKGSNRRRKAVAKVAKVDRFLPSTRLCSNCGRINDKMTLGVRSWECPCGSTHDRDHNAAKNVLAAGQADNSYDRGAWVRPAAMQAPRGEAVTHPDAAHSRRGVEGMSVL